MKKRSLLLLLLTLACNREQPAAAPPAPQPIAGDAARGRELVAKYACTVCHAIPGTQGPQGALGPALAGLATRPTISEGTVQNTPENIRRFIQNPASMNPMSSMPPINGLPENDAQDITAFLLTLK